MATYTSDLYSLVQQGRTKLPNKFVVVYRCRTGTSTATIQFKGLTGASATPVNLTSAVALDTHDAAHPVRSSVEYGVPVIDSNINNVVSFYYVVENIEDLDELPYITVQSTLVQSITEVASAADYAAAIGGYNTEVPLRYEPPSNLIFQGKKQVIDKLIFHHRNVDDSDAPGVIVVGYNNNHPTFLISNDTGDDGASLGDYGWGQALEAINDYDAGDAVYSGTYPGGTDDMFSYHTPVSLLQPTSSPYICSTTLSATFVPCEAYKIFVYGLDHLNTIYGIDVVFKHAVPLT